MSAVLTVTGVKLLRGEREVLRDVDVAVGKGERVALMGLSGGGKTTLLRAVLALEPFHAGTIDVDGFALSPGPLPRPAALKPLRQRVGMVFQLHNLFEHLTARQNVALAPVHVLGKKLHEAEERAGELLASLGVGHRAGAYPREMSGGEAQRVAIARALAMDPHLLLMDEPTASLDPARRDELGATLAELSGAGRTLVVVTHDEDFVREHTTRVVVMADGRVVEEGESAKVLAAPSHPATRQLLGVDAGAARP